MSTFVDAQEYVVVNCGAEEHGGAFMFAVTREFYDWTRRGNGWTCPMGHSRRWLGDSPEQKLQKAEARETALRDQLEASIRDGEAQRVELARIRQRIANGVCPCCNRSFDNVRRHIASQHPDYAVDVPVEKRVRFECGCGLKFDTYRGLRTHQGLMRPEDWSKPGQPYYRSHLTVGASR